jgi:colanic acid/amylovoran biosynthesis glycosyltransferase
MNKILEQYICGLAAFIQNETIEHKYPVFNLNGRQPNFLERQLIRLKLLKYDFNRIMRDELLDRIKGSRADVVIVHFATTAHYLWDVLEKLDIPIFIYVHGYDIIWDCKNDDGDKVHSELYASEIFKISQNSNVIFIANSDRSFENLISINILENKIKKKVFGVDLPVIQRDYTKINLQILFLGRFVDFKGPDIVLNAFIKACDLGFKGTLVMAGDGPLKNMCKIISKRSKYFNNIFFINAVSKEQAEELYKESDIYSMHSIHGTLSNGVETFGVTYIEAMSFGLPVVTASFGGPAQIIEDGIDGILVQAYNVDEHAKAFMKLFNNISLRQNLGINARNKVKNHFSTNIEKQQLYSILGIKMSN